MLSVSITQPGYQRGRVGCGSHPGLCHQFPELTSTPSLAGSRMVAFLRGRTERP